MGLDVTNPVFRVSHKAGLRLFANPEDRFTVTPVENCHSQKDKKNGFQDRLSLNAGHNIADCSKGSIMQYFRPSFSYQLSFSPLFGLLFEWPFYTGFTVWFPVKQSDYQILDVQSL